MGRLIPAGTGLTRSKRIGIQIDAPEDMLSGAEQEGLTVTSAGLAPSPPAAAPAPIDESIPVLSGSSEIGGET